ncbi:helix-turn-helix domain-containing protein [Streptomyces sp. NBC_00663]|uniref:helix-turn-helix domain-containing protein n=1 Tax=Streptomyces sp. NBC_00663 TaxID=2975801 RepID=UPI002E2F5C11|nr:helix-turn-helix domain-containing protein [Streptomyces sp. NBC_00663]
MRAPTRGERSFSAAYGDVELVVRADPEFWRGSLRLLHLGMLQIATEESDAVEVVRTARDATADGRTHLFARLQLEGTALVFQDGRRARLRPGDLAFHDAGRPFSLALPERQRAHVLMIPRQLVRLSEADIGRVMARTIGATVGAAATEDPAALLLPLLTGLVDEIDAATPAAREELARAVTDLLAALAAAQLTGTGHQRPPAGSGETALFERVRTTIETRLGEPELSPRVLAEAHGISLRYLHKLFQERSTTVGAWIRRRRLEACRAELARPSAAERSIAAVAARWGFASPAHFSHTFRKAYGMSPAQYRAQGHSN